MDEIEFYLEDLKSRFLGIDGSKYYLSYSGGKDSHFLYWFIKEYLHDDKIEIVSVNTRMEHPEIMKRMYKYADRVLLPEHTIQWAIEKYGMPCFSKQKDDFISRYQNGCRSDSLMTHIYGYNPKTGKPDRRFRLSKAVAKKLLDGELHKISSKCCEVTKKRTFHKYEKESGRKAIIGVRSTEGVLRADKYKSCFSSSGRFTPIYDLQDEMLDAIYERFNIEIPKIYAYINRTGCMGCPYGNFSGSTKVELELMSDNQRKYVVSLFKDSYEELGIDYNNIQERLF